MDYLFAQLSKIEGLLRNNFILLLLDYDGTLTPIAETPGKALISQGVKELLRKLSNSPDCKIGIISGRALKNIKNIVGIEDIIYAGNYGLEIQGPKIKFESRVSPGIKLVIRNLAKNLEKLISGIKGALIDDKGLSLSVHYRLVDKKDMPSFKKIISEAAHVYTARDMIRINPGKKVYEIMPSVKWDKGKVALWLLARQQFITGEKNVLPVYIGDDSSDEAAFKALKRKGMTIFVGGAGDSKANYYLKDTEEVICFLRLILALKQH